MLVAPAGVALILLFLLPLTRVLWQSFTEPVPGIGNYVGLFTDGYTVTVLVRTLVVAGSVAFFTSVIGYPYAYMMTLQTPRMRAAMITLVLVPFWTSMMARNFAWVVLLERNGLVERVFSLLGVDGVILIRTPLGVAVAMTQVLLPFVVLPMYASMEQIDRRLLLAGESLGASRVRSFIRIYLPLSLPGVVAGAALVFVIALGFYVTPALIGAPQHALIAQLIQIRVGQLLDFGTAGALGIFLLMTTLAVLWVSKGLAGSVPSGLSAAAASGRRAER